jgi:hypothetical protein
LGIGGHATLGEWDNERDDESKDPQPIWMLDCEIWIAEWIALDCGWKSIDHA